MSAKNAVGPNWAKAILSSMLLMFFFFAENKMMV